jgi:hypothetical protein
MFISRILLGFSQFWLYQSTFIYNFCNWNYSNNNDIYVMGFLKSILITFLQSYFIKSIYNICVNWVYNIFLKFLKFQQIATFENVKFLDNHILTKNSMNMHDVEKIEMNFKAFDFSKL